LLLALALRYSRFDIRKLFPQNRHNRYLFLLILTGSIEFSLILVMNTSFFLRDNNSPLTQIYTPQSQMVFQLLILGLFILIVFLFRVYLNLTIHRVEEETGTPYLKNIHDMLTAIRSIKHDSLNHYTAINGFLKKGLYDLAKEYVEQLLQETVITEKKVDYSSHILESIKNPAVSSLLQSKMALCLAERITLTMSINTSNQFSHIKTYDLIKVLGNLLDNAIRATSYELEENRYIRFEWGQSEHDQFLLIENSGPIIPKERLEDIFKMGYTTKTNGEGGLGLAIVKSVTERYGGNIQVSSEEGVTRFCISFQNR
jgi:sensor histidine kinase regulating citrate/malate metabolism